MKKMFLIFCIVLVLVACAQETTELFTISYFGNGNTSGFVPIDTNQYKSGNSAIIQSNDSFYKLNNTFSSWNTKADGTGTLYHAGDSIIVIANISLYAIWTESEKYAVSFINEEMQYLEPVNLFSGEKITEPEKPSKAGYTFIGWFAENETEKWNFNVDIVSKDITLYARWELIELPNIDINTSFIYEKTTWIQNGTERIYTNNGKLTYILKWIDPSYSTFSHIIFESYWDEILYRVNKGIQQLIIEYGPYDRLKEVQRIHGIAKTVDIYGNKSTGNSFPSIPGIFIPFTIPAQFSVDVDNVVYASNIITWTNPTDARFYGILIVENNNNNNFTRNIFLDKVTSYIPDKDVISVTIYSINSIAGGLSSGVEKNLY